MTEIVTVDAEVVVPLDLAAAKRLHQRIELLVSTIRDSMDKLHDLVAEAKRGEIHVALGYPSWPAYLADVFSLRQVRLERPQRRELVGWLSGEGLSQRVIADVVGSAVGTVNADLAAGVQNRTPEPGAELNAPQNIELEPAVTKGRDDKAYPRPVPADPKPRRRRPITDAFETGIFDLNKVIGRLARISNDDRFGRNAEALRHRSNDLIRARDAIDLMVARLDPDEFIAHSDRQDAAARRVVRELFAAVEAVTDDA